jgi:hypothetical protein
VRDRLEDEKGGRNVICYLNCSMSSVKILQSHLRSITNKNDSRFGMTGG